MPAIVKRAHSALRKAFAAADALALELCSLHFASGGRRAQLAGSSSGSIVATSSNSTQDSNDDFLDLQFWKKRFEDVKTEALEWKEEVGVVVFHETVTWLEHTILSTI